MISLQPVIVTALINSLTKEGQDFAESVNLCAELGVELYVDLGAESGKLSRRVDRTTSCLRVATSCLRGAPTAR